MEKLEFSAKEPTLGYLYQIKYALLVLLNSENPESSIKIESLDDIELIEDNRISLFQTKYHRKSVSNLTDRHKDFWKTIRIWSSLIKANLINTKYSKFILITTAKVPENTAIKQIMNNHDTTSIIKFLDSISSEKNIENQKGYDIYGSLTQDQKEALIKNIVVVDNSLDFDSIEIQIKQQLKLTTSPSRILELYERLSGWWLEQSILNLLEKKDELTFLETQEKIWYINDQLKSDNLPIDYPENIKIDDEQLESMSELTYIQQLSLVSMSNRLKKVAMSDYMRAFAQRSKWVRGELLNTQEEISYEKKLEDYWNRLFEMLTDDSESCSPEDLILIGQKFYKEYFYKNPPPIYIRERCTDLFVVLGSYQILADSLKVGWHPKFKELIIKE